MAQYQSVIFALLFAVVVVIQFSTSAPVSSTLVGLYGPEDNVFVLTGQNFNKTVFNSPFIWMVEFYASWCGHCQEFAPTFKALAKDIAEWEQVYRLAVINCPDDINRPVCTNMDVRAYPDMRIFPPFSGNEIVGTKVDERTVESLRNISVYYIDEYLDDVKWDLPGTLKPTFEFITYEKILDYVMDHRSPYYLAVVIEMPSSEMGKEIILDISSCKNITTRRFNSASPEIKKLVEYTGINFQELPTVVVLGKAEKAFEINVMMRRRSFYSYKLRKLPGVGEPKMLPKQILDRGTKTRESYIDWTKVDRGVVYQADIESGLRYALTVEVGSTKILEGGSLEGLKNFIGTLALLSEHLPASEPTRNFIVRLIGWLAGKSSIDYKTWQKRMETVEHGSYLPKIDKRWVGCAPSKPGLRGYPCSLWTLFHSLTVAAYNKNEIDVQAVPRAMESYISNFFSCMECRKNFIKELIDSPYEGIKSTKEAILWLWELHNKVNKRLHGAVSEDPNIPKVQFPPIELCPKCRDKDGSWNRRNVLKYLVNRYSSDKVSTNFLELVEVENPVLPRKNDIGIIRRGRFGEGIWGRNSDSEQMLEVQAALEDHDFDAGDKEYEIPDDALERDVLHPHVINEALGDRKKAESLHVMKQLGDREMRRRISAREREWSNSRYEASFTNFDASLCFVLWGTSLLTVVLMYLYMRRRTSLKNCKV